MASSCKIYPASIWLSIGEIKNVVAAGYDDGVPNQAAAFTSFGSANSSIALTRPGWFNAGDLNVPGTPPPNFLEIVGVAAGDTTVTATYNSVPATPIPVHVNDPAAAPNAVITEGNQTKKTGQVVELNFESSTGVGYRNGQYDITVNWGDGDSTYGMLSACHCYREAGIYTVTLTVRNQSFASSSASITVTVQNFPAPTQVFNVSTPSALLSAWNSCTGGEEIRLDRAAVWNTPIVLPTRTFSDFVTIRTNGTLPPRGTRINPDSDQLVTLTHTAVNDIPLSFSNGQAKVRLQGLKFSSIVNNPFPTLPGTYFLLGIPNPEINQTTVADNPTDFILEHIAVKLPADVYVVHAIANSGRKVSLSDSYIGGVKTTGGQDCQAVYTLDGAGGHSYINCYFEAASQSWMAGGDQNRIEGLVPKNIEIRRCYMSKQMSWMAYTGGGAGHPINVKTIFESKNARRVYVEGCVMENHWDALRSQYFAIVTKTSVESSGDFNPHAMCEDFRFENCIVRNVHGGVTASVDNYGGSYQGIKPHGIVYKNVAFIKIDKVFSYNGTSSQSRAFQPNNIESLVFDHCTFIQTTDGNATAYFNSNNCYDFTVKDSILGLINYGFIGTATGVGYQTLNYGTGGTTGSTNSKDADARFSMFGNVVPNYTGNNNFPNTPPDTNVYLANYNQVGFVNFTGDASGNYALSPSSPYVGTASDGTDPGVNWTLMNARTSTTESGSGWMPGTPSPGPLLFGSNALVYNGTQHLRVGS